MPVDEGTKPPVAGTWSRVLMGSSEPPPPLVDEAPSDKTPVNKAVSRFDLLDKARSRDTLLDDEQWSGDPWEDEDSWRAIGPVLPQPALGADSKETLRPPFSSSEAPTVPRAEPAGNGRHRLLVPLSVVSVAVVAAAAAFGAALGTSVSGVLSGTVKPTSIEAALPAPTATSDPTANSPTVASAGAPEPAAQAPAATRSAVATASATKPTVPPSAAQLPPPEAPEPEDAPRTESERIFAIAKRREATRTRESVEWLRTELSKPHPVANRAKVQALLASVDAAGVDGVRELMRLPGPTGTDLLYELWTRSRARTPVSTLAEELLRTEEAAQRMSPALSVILALRWAQTCETVEKAVQRAQAVADARAVYPLERLRVNKGCPPELKRCQQCATPGRFNAALRAAARRKAPW